MTDLFTKTVTIYNDIPETDSAPRSFERHIIEKCLISDKRTEKNQGTVTQNSGSKQIITKDISHYLPSVEFLEQSLLDRKNFYTVQTGDFIVFDVVNDVVNTAKDFAELQKKYKSKGIKVTAFETYINGMKTDNITILNS